MPNIPRIIQRLRGGSRLIEVDEAGGVYPKTKALGKRVELITLPIFIPGKNCGTCTFFNVVPSPGFCENTEVRQSVSERNSCKLWSNPEVIKHW
jgi:hypothetical protein